ncbi:hypothetical protein [Sphingomonas oryzagri]|uniref:Uncharacterized protein n=1 Tax=Sphingomonas oryzagri TaxID=3042314 RepID=A0ABT6MX31_9SPHN|nr:hypothetical protein [Sphingomonas oryzagri]MDH7637363.1 hypothetical protein [Sphingomonas oryzagri]
MKPRHFALAILALTTSASTTWAQAPAAPPASSIPARYQNFRAAIYIAVGDARKLADRATFDRQYARAASQLHFDKVYIEAYRDHDFATDDELEKVKSYFAEKGIETAGGITLAAGGKNGQFGTFDYEDPADRAECERAARLAARHFNEVILDDFFFYTSKSDADIAAKGKRSWTQYRLDTMRKVARDLVIGPAKAANPHVRMIIKYPNWYEHFQGLGYDLDQEARMFDGIHTGTESRDPTLTDQLLQQYESYEIIRYYDNIRPGANTGGWVDEASTRDIDRYAEQLWDTLFAKTGEVTLFNWRPMSNDDAAEAGIRPWAHQATSFDWQAELRRWRSSGNDLPPGWGRAAGLALESVDKVLGSLGNPIGIASYKPYQSSGEDFLHNYLGMIGLPIELSPNFPDKANTILLTQAAAADPAIVGKIEGALKRGATVIVTSGLVEALQDKGFHDLAEWTPTGRRVLIDQFVEGFGAGNGTSLNAADATQKPILFPDVRFYTNDSWAIVRGVAGAKGFPLLLMNHYSAGTLYMLTVPENPSDLYALPPAVLSQIRAVAQKTMPVWIDAPAQVSLFAYDNDTFVVQSFRAEATPVTLHIAGHALQDLQTGATLNTAPQTSAESSDGRNTDTRNIVPTVIPPHSYVAFRVIR